MICLVAIPPASVEPIWKRLDTAFATACEKSRGFFSKDSIRSDAIAGRVTIWIAADASPGHEVTAACVTAVNQFPGGLRALIVGPLGGTVKFDIFDFRTTLEKHAKAEGCSAVLFMIPRRWASKLPDYDMANCLMCKELG